MRYTGEFRHTLDAKNRIIIPAKFRAGLGDTFMVSKWLDGCLAVFPMETWNDVAERMSRMSAGKKESRQFMRKLMSSANECTFDSQGRVQLPQLLLEKGGFVKNCAIIGVGDRVEIWPLEKWEAYSDEAEEVFDAVAEELTEYI